jgi:hypothetical protein
MTKIAYNACFGGFSLSDKAVHLARKISGDPRWGEYIGKATYARQRLRQYNRSTGPETDRPFRTVHLGIRSAWTAGGQIDVWVFAVPLDFAEKLNELETRWIKEKRPSWNS